MISSKSHLTPIGSSSCFPGRWKFQFKARKSRVAASIWGTIVSDGVSPATLQLEQQLERVVPTNSRVMLSGAPGLERPVARLIHEQSRRQENPFVVLNCANT